LEGFGEKKADNFLNAVEASKRQPLSRLINALGIRGVGEVMAASLANQYRNVDELLAASVEELQTVEGVGPNIAQSIVDWFQRGENRALIQKLKELGVDPQNERRQTLTANEKLPFAGMTFVLTGTLPNYSRTEMTAFIQARGGKVVGSVSAKTSYVVAGEAPGSKLQKAQSLQVQVLDETGVIALAGE